MVFIFLFYLPVSGDRQVAINWMLVPDPSNLVIANTPAAEPGLVMMWAVSPIMLTGTLIEKPSSHSQVWFWRTSEVAATSWPRSHTLNVRFRGSPFGTRTLRSSNLRGKVMNFIITQLIIDIYLTPRGLGPTLNMMESTVGIVRPSG